MKDIIHTVVNTIGASYRKTSETIDAALNKHKMIRRSLVVWAAALITSAYMLAYDVITQMAAMITAVDEHSVGFLTVVVSLITATTVILTAVIGLYQHNRSGQDSKATADEVHQKIRGLSEEIKTVKQQAATKVPVDIPDEPPEDFK